MRSMSQLSVFFVRRKRLLLLYGLLAGGLVLATFLKREAVFENRVEAQRPKIAAPELEGGVSWLNTAGPLRIRDLRGKIVVLDFWTYCCINCIHTLPDLAKLEKKFPNELVVIGV